MKFRRMLFHAPDTDSSAPLATAVATAVTDALPKVDSPQPNGEGKKKEEKLDEQAEFFVRRIASEVTKSIAELLKPSKSADDDDDDDDDEEDSPVKRKRRTSVPPTKKKAFFITFFGGG